MRRLYLGGPDSDGDKAQLAYGKHVHEMTPKIVAVLLFVAFNGIPSLALAQQGAPAGPSVPSEVRPAGGNGLKLGSARLHTFLQVDSQFVTNPGYMPGASRPNDLALVGRPGVELLMPSDKLDLTLKADVAWAQYLGIQNQNTRQLSGFSSHANVNANINKTSGFGIRLRDSFVRSNDPANQTVAERMQRVANDAGLGFDIRPGGGALIFSVDYGFYFERYDRGHAWAGNLDNYRHRPNLRATWKFLPKTAVFVEATGELTRFYDSNYNVDSNLVFALVGASGAVTQRIAVLIKAGYANALLKTRDNFNSAVGQVEFNYLASETTRFRVGALRTAQPTALFKLFDMLRGYVAYDQAIGGRLQFSGIVSYNRFGFGQAVRGPATSRDDNQVTGDLVLTYQLTEWVTFVLDDRLDWRTSNYTSQAGLGSNYFNNTIIGRVGVRY